MFSVIIPSYNHERYILDAIRSAMQEALVTEILIGDDGSRDGSLGMIEHIAKSYPSLVVNLTQYPPTNIGAHAMLNRLISAASNPWISVLNSDDMFIPGRHSNAKACIRLSQAEFLFGNITIIDEHNTTIGQKRAFFDPQFEFPSPPDPTNLLPAMLSQNFIATTSNMLFSKRLWESVGGFRDYRYAHDWDFAIRCLLTAKTQYVPEPLTYYRVHSSNTIKEARTQQDAEVKRIFATLTADFGANAFSDHAAFLSSNEYLR